ncbi:30S ribosome-binding factor RbfA [Aerococcaceae bacterium zg-ZJ1578]|uniref:30S ribosome-binding factor RbfA n=1 Tax=Aerococcaceae TaxID=186827 RepID=UPI0013BD0125|nr:MULTISPECIES: 30S ribosome-binding factor RbfA [unclassified Facklamia]MBK0347372.1 30S ribosome-binding factor RbfA [Aerococcaceae bacterium zg-1578]MBR7927012.1 30S ribosome-binding factor RbfA [Aerococcaceae bacterium zg-ZUI334]MBS4461862.1 30S ribosome-binding factor RbfA [Aerococcaceae bacterium zg-B36]QQD66380.1 30S ribosome-binding factor RbfA [Aerococcaceae bacterium zg-252]NEW63603.1 30S ribosome-binding factor RbfA [Facklamia sp. 252]
MANYRHGRVRQEIMREVNRILMREIKDPRIEGVTITDVELTGDLQQATIFYSTLSDKAGARQKTQAGLEAVKGKVRSELGKAIQLYKVPELTFERDSSIDYGNRIDALLNQLNTSKAEEVEETEDTFEEE